MPAILSSVVLTHPPMTDVQFNDEMTTAKPKPVEAPQGLYKLVISLGLARDMQGARTVLLVVAVLAIIIGVVFPFIV